MVHCIVVGCINNSGRRRGIRGISFFRIPKVIFGSAREEEISRKRRDGFLAAVSRADLTDSKLENGRVCSKHFLSGKPAPLFDKTSPDWLPTEKLGHEKISRKRVDAFQEHYQRKRARLEQLTAKRDASMNDVSLEGASGDVEGGAAGAGVDAVEGSAGVDAVEGSAGMDAVEGSAGVDTVEGVNPTTGTVTCC